MTMMMIMTLMCLARNYTITVPTAEAPVKRLDMRIRVRGKS